MSDRISLTQPQSRFRHGRALFRQQIAAGRWRIVIGLNEGSNHQRTRLLDENAKTSFMLKARSRGKSSDHVVQAAVFGRFPMG